ncbi:hypothetical protein ZIOFF_047035 [Zingiber officinale]|uniref:ADP/ATP translocase n=1 Tax=Zingiber officinale TaxID=94328 RepID=A0A8J5G5K4_ZINOF|nr:hypothetical protein ZIOFF_047035 [Zingiber officinale]
MFGKRERFRLWLMYRSFDYNIAGQINHPTSIHSISGPEFRKMCHLILRDVAYRDGYWKWFASNLGSGGAAGACSFLFVYSLDYAGTRLANDAKAAKKGGERQFNGLIDVYRKTLQSDGIVGVYRGFNIS